MTTTSGPTGRRLRGAVTLGLLIAGLATVARAAPDGELDEIVVTATLRAEPVLATPASVTVLAGAALHDGGQQHLEESLALVPNLNWAGDTARPRYFQLRGIGELEQYEGAPNPSIGFLIDDIDFSGLGSAATLFDVDRVEVLRGPQGTRYGANALGGLIYVASAEPATAFGGRLELGAGDYGGRSVGAVVTGPVEALDSAFRLAVQRYTSDGYYRNVYLNRDTDNQDELTLRGRWRYQPSARLRLDLTVLHVQLDDGYDAFSPDNTRRTLSDQPSVDAQHSSGAALKLRYAGATERDPVLTAIATVAETRLKYGYDGDWGNPGYWANCAPGTGVSCTYQFSELQFRDRRTASAELRLGTEATSGPAWLVGAYAMQLRETLNDTSVGSSFDPYNGAYAQDLVIASGYRSTSTALFGVLDGDLGPRLRWSLGLRGEHRSASYHDETTDALTGATTASAFRPSDGLWGGHASLRYEPAADQALYVELARGYKAGGFNLSQGLAADERLFRPESDLSVEAGWKAELGARRLRIQADLFAVARRDAQLKTSVQLDPSNPNTFVFYTGNAERGFNDGAELALDWRATPRLSLGGSLGLLETRFRDFVRIGDSGGANVSRELANAPHWQAALYAAFRDPRGPFARLEATGMGGYYFDLPPNDTRSHPYGLLHARLGWEAPGWSVTLWGRNLLDKDYPVRGFYFGLVPPDYPNRLYLQLGEPRHFGLDATVRFGGR
ncbi:MAG: TonB-dependent receptor [Proteobacteria bacterium]|nr:TonB-dependent receptor [Pseudomonadota bacterium]